jgi:hypothetical protein
MVPNPDGPEATMIMPFVACQTNGGPFDDGSFSAGFAAGQLWAELECGDVPSDRPILVELADQMDLIAMNFGYRMEVLVEAETELAEWMMVRFVPESDTDAPT